MSNTPFILTGAMPWDRLADEEKLFRRLSALFILIFFIITLVVPRIPLPEKQREEVERIPPRLAKLVMERQKPQPPKVEEKPKEELKKEEPKKEEPKKKEETKKEEVKKDTPKPKKEDVKKPQPSRQEAARKQAVAAVAVFDDALADLREMDTSSLQAPQQEVTTAAATVAGPGMTTGRALIGKAAMGSSGGVAVAKASAGSGGSGKLGRAPGTGMQASSVKSAIADPAAKAAEKRGPGGKARRTMEDIQLVFDRNKGAIYSIYRRALRENPALEGTLVLRLEIQPNGKVSRCDIVSSELKDPDLERKIVTKVRSINFGTMAVDVWRDSYPISFIPS